MVDSKQQWKAWIYLAPCLLLLIVFTFNPIVNTLRIAFLEGYSPLADQAGDASWSFGFDNFKNVVTYDDFQTCLSNTLLLTVLTVPLSCFIALLIAVFLNNIPYFSKVFQTIYFLPYVTNSIAIGMVFAMMFTIVGLKPIEVSGESSQSLVFVHNESIRVIEGSPFLNYSDISNDLIKGGYNVFTKDLVKQIVQIFDAKQTKKIVINNDNIDALQNGNLDSSILALGISQTDLDAFKDYFNTKLNSLNIHYEDKTYGYTYTSLGIINNIIEVFGREPVNWLNTSSTHSANMAVMTIYIVWNALPFKILILLGGLQSVNKQYYDAAKIDGANGVTIFFRITVPLLSPMIAYVVITGFIGGFKEYTSIVGIFGDSMGAPGQAGEMNTMVGYIYDQISNDAYGVASAAALILFAIIMAVTLLNLYVSKKKVHY